MSAIPRDTANLLLRALSDADYALLAPGLRRTQLRMRQVLVERNEPIEQLYFFDDGVASVVSDDEEGDAVEIGLFGRRRHCREAPSFLEATGRRCNALSRSAIPRPA
jgi:CRP-like cAMP-binding protein